MYLENRSRDWEEADHKVGVESGGGTVAVINDREIAKSNNKGVWADDFSKGWYGYLGDINNTYIKQMGNPKMKQAARWAGGEEEEEEQKRVRVREKILAECYPWHATESKPTRRTIADIQSWSLRPNKTNLRRPEKASKIGDTDSQDHRLGARRSFVACSVGLPGCWTLHPTRSA